MRILIAGGGVGGLTLALMLREKGIEGQVLEAAAEVRPFGVGINALPHSVRELAALGLLPRLDEIAIRTRRLTYANHLGQEIWSEARGLHAGHEVPQFSIHRGRLQAMLWQAAMERLGEAAPRSDRRLVSFAPDGDKVVARFRSADGSESEEIGDALIGADGIHSTLRATLHPEDPGIRWNGIQMWRGALDWPAFGDGESMVIAGDAVAKLVLYPIALGGTPETRLTNWVIYARTGQPGEPPPKRENWSRRGQYADFRHLVERLDLPFIDVGAMIRATAEIFEYPMCDRDPLPWWTQGAVTLLGDAAHPMYPVGSNGASQAILDARCLADLLTRMPVAEALAAYEAERLPATAAVVRSNRVGGPERVVDVIAERAPKGFTRIGDVATAEELEGIVRGYAQLAGFAVAKPA
ncbi:flavin-dependent oxidoreductase [Roseomonas harenae]|uniref:flavin-dependent oxidoreductase n=1 Tax=Muricoccus harenae TaxID=2692566 RepID=UPI001331BE75|nr:flavin-dependent oxidoreductase [Roseomonas harenae]